MCLEVTKVRSELSFFCCLQVLPLAFPRFTLPSSRGLMGKYSCWHFSVFQLFFSWKFRCFNIVKCRSQVDRRLCAASSTTASQAAFSRLASWRQRVSGSVCSYLCVCAEWTMTEPSSLTQCCLSFSGLTGSLSVKLTVLVGGVAPRT